MRPHLTSLNLNFRRLKSDEDKIIKNIETDKEKQEEFKEARQAIQDDLETLDAGILEVGGL